MKTLAIILIVLVVIVVVFGLYVRLAPTDQSVWHVPPADEPPGDYLEEGSFLAVRPINEPGPELLSHLDAIALATPRTVRIAGSPGEDMITWRTRSALWGFPDFTTARVADGKLSVYGRLRFGKGDMGVNRKRVEHWLAQLEADGPGE
ncbi:DUF1499 domain-containing protein [Pseudoroseicyclus sp. H15]